MVLQAFSYGNELEDLEFVDRFGRRRMVKKIKSTLASVSGTVEAKLTIHPRNFPQLAFFNNAYALLCFCR